MPTSILNNDFNDGDWLPDHWSYEYQSANGSASLGKHSGGYDNNTPDSSDSALIGFAPGDITKKGDYVYFKQLITPVTNRLGISIWREFASVNSNVDFKIFIDGDEVYSETLNSTIGWERISCINSVIADTSTEIKFGIIATGDFDNIVDVHCDFIEAWDCPEGGGSYNDSFTLAVGDINYGPGIVKYEQYGSGDVWLKCTDPHGTEHDIFLTTDESNHESWSVSGDNEYWKLFAEYVSSSMVTIHEIWWIALDGCDRYVSENVWQNIVPDDGNTGTIPEDVWATFPYARNNTPSGDTLQLIGDFICSDGVLKPANKNIIYNPTGTTILSKS